MSCLVFRALLAVDVKTMLAFDDIFLGHMQQGQGVTARREYDTVFALADLNFETLVLLR